VAAVEVLKVIHLSGDRGVLGIREYAGTATSIAIPLRAILADVLKFDSKGLILSHDHPSGDATPSRADIDATHALLRLVEPLGVRLHDHLVRGGDRHVSFRTLGLL
jgi:DNA repair protein RadC